MESNSASTGWGTWSLPTKLTVGVGLLLAAVLVVVLYLPR
jgi:hypothetical protein